MTANIAREFHRFLPITAGVFFLIMMVIYVSGLHVQNGFVRERELFVIGRDFLNGWMMGQAALHEPQPEDNYDIDHYVPKLQELLGTGYAQQWSYPPSMMLAMVPFGLLPYHLALVVFTGMGIWGLWYACLRGAPKTARYALLASPAVWMCLLCGQLAMIAASLQFLIFRFLDRRPIVAGALLGALTLKPQLGLMYPFFLIATGRWKVFLAAMMMSIFLAGAVYLVWGSAAWVAYLDKLPLMQEQLLHDARAGIAVYSPTLFMDFWYLGADKQFCSAVQIIAGVGAIALVFTPRFRRMDNAAQMLIIAAGGVLATPYLMAYDFVFFTAALVAYAWQKPIRNGWEFGLVAGCFWLPLVHFLAATVHLPGTTILPVVLVGWVMVRKEAIVP